MPMKLLKKQGELIAECRTADEDDPVELVAAYDAASKGGMVSLFADTNDFDEDQVSVTLRPGSIVAGADVTLPEGEDTPDATRPGAVARSRGLAP